VITRARLKSRGEELAAILAAPSSEIRSELLLVDETNHLFGVLDIAALGAGGMIVDLKTGHETSATDSGANRHQMTFYAHLFRAAYGVLPQQLIVFSLQHGPRVIELTPSSISTLLDGVRAARLVDSTVAHPQPDTCRFCPKRMRCEPHWDAVPTWDHPDAVEGVVMDVEYSSSGSAAVLIGDRWLSGVPASELGKGGAVGQFARAVRVHRRDHVGPEEWLATSATHINLFGLATTIGGQ
jgi:hypothetical protein